MNSSVYRSRNQGRSPSPHTAALLWLCCGARALLTSLVNERRLLLDSQFDASVIPLFLIRMWAVVKRIHGSDTTYMFRRGRTLSSVNRCLSSKLNVNRQSHNSSIGYGLCSMRFAFADVISSHTLICLHTRRGMIDWVKLGGTLESYGRALSQRIHAASPSQAPRKPRGQAGHPQGRPSPFFRRVGVARTTWQDRPKTVQACPYASAAHSHTQVRGRTAYAS